MPTFAPYPRRPRPDPSMGGPPTADTFLARSPEELDAIRRAIGRSSAEEQRRARRRRERAERENHEASQHGRRAPRFSPLAERDLYVNGVTPAALQSNNPDLACAVCLDVLAHPVLTACGHGYCYACIRMWLERAWTCPLCKRVMEHAPVRDSVQEAVIAQEFPDRVDSSVLYLWDGLEFPQRS
ncbi:hypothetical protein C8R44DRAFT_873852 [Mycena epipterygia]|nr:hypothetical protein C8R44DRAFT_873852 [Mycena epipterygia]